MDHGALWLASDGIGIPGMILQLIKDLHTDSIIYEELQQANCQLHLIHHAMTDSAVYSHLPFCCTIDFIMKQVSRNAIVSALEVTHLQTSTTGMMWCSISTPVISSSTEQESRKVGLHVSWSQIKVQHLGAGWDARYVFIDAQKVEGVTEFVYLGSKYVSDSKSFSECACSIGIAAGAMEECSGVWSQ